jgi:hypothetical protein
MRIFYDSRSSDPMVLDREAALHGLARELRQLATEARLDEVFTAETNGSPDPYAEFLPGLRVQKMKGDYLECHLAKDRWLELRANQADLEKLCQNLERLQNGGHVHLYSSPISLIFEADDSWPGFDEGY